MHRTEFERMTKELYGTGPERLFSRNPGYEVFRHEASGKWFALVMDLPASRLGLPGDDVIDVANLKCDPDLAAVLRHRDGFHPAYHMNKEHWLTVELACVDSETMADLLAMSHGLTAPRPAKKHRRAS